MPIDIKPFIAIIAVILLYTVIVMLVMPLGGCSSIFKAITGENQQQQIDQNETSVPFVNSKPINRLVAICIIGLALSIMAVINGSKTAIGWVVGCGLALALTITVQIYAKAIAITTLGISIAFLVWSLFVKGGFLTIQTVLQKNEKEPEAKKEKLALTGSLEQDLEQV